MGPVAIPSGDRPRFLAVFISNEQRRNILAKRHRLTDSAKTDVVADIADAMVGLHSSDPSTVFLSAAARMKSPSFEALHHALYVDKSVVRHHAMRRTLWVFSRKTASICNVAATRRIAESERRRTVELLENNAGLANGDAWLSAASDQVLKFMSERGPVLTRELGKALPELRVPIPTSPGKAYGGNTPALARVVLQLGFEGKVLRGEPNGGWNTSEYSWSPASSWVPGGLGDPDPQSATDRLTLLWLSAFGPAPASDFQWWTGWPKGTCTKALERMGVQVELESGSPTAEPNPGWMHPDDVAELAGEPDQWIALLPALDPTTMGWKNRDWYVNPAYVAKLFDRNGNGGPTIWINGRVVGGWTQLLDGQIAHRLFEDLSAAQTSEIRQACERQREFLGDKRFKVRFPVPLQAELKAS